jgi:hypothetical protein
MGRGEMKAKIDIYQCSFFGLCNEWKWTFDVRVRNLTITQNKEHGFATKAGAKKAAIRAAQLVGATVIEFEGE